MKHATDGARGPAGRGSGWGWGWGWVAACLLAATALMPRGAEEGREPAGPGVSVGTVVAFGGPATAVPESQGWMLCDGRELAASAHPALFAVLGGAWGKDASGARFRLPDLRGRFPRGVNYDAPEGYRDPDHATREASAPGGNTGNEVGTLQGDETGPHTHPFMAAPNGIGVGMDQGVPRLYATKLPDEAAPMVTTDAAVRPGPGSETRPRNVYVNWIIRVR